jgi:hypothetical protein
MGLCAVFCGRCNVLVGIVVPSNFVIVGGFLMRVLGRSVMCGGREMCVDSGVLRSCCCNGLVSCFLGSGSPVR